MIGYTHWDEHTHRKSYAGCMLGTKHYIAELYGYERNEMWISAENIKRFSLTCLSSLA
jgi:hypothetical protein